MILSASCGYSGLAPRLSAGPYWRPSGSLDGSPSPQPWIGTGRYQYCEQLIKFLIPKFEFHDYSIRALKALCDSTGSDYPETAICGGAGSSKSTAVGAYALIWWMCCPEGSAVLIASTTIAAALQRIWKNVSEFYLTAARRTGGIGESVIIGKPRPEIRTKQKDFAHGLFVVAVAQGDVQKAIDELKGRHPRRIMVVGDETDSISQAIIDVCANLAVGTDEFQAVWLGNLPSAFNPLGQMMSPGIGLPVTASLGTDWVSAKKVQCLRFDGEDSPNIRDNGKWTGIIGQKDIDRIASRWGKNSPQYWIMVKGLPPPIGADNTVLTESLLFRYKCMESVKWQHNYISSVLLDPAFGGDRCVIRRIDRGLTIEPTNLDPSGIFPADAVGDGKLRVLFHQPISLQINANDTANPPEYQIAQQVMEFCRAHSVPPEEFILDATGTGRGVASVLQREWSPNIVVCEFGGAASDKPVSDENPMPANKEYDRKVSELYFSFREFVQAGMIRGLDNETAQEFCQREFSLKGSGEGKRTSLQTKAELKSDGRPSPDLADNAVLGTELLRRKGINATIITQVKEQAHQEVDRVVEEWDQLDGEDAYTEEFADL